MNRVDTSFLARKKKYGHVNIKKKISMLLFLNHVTTRDDHLCEDVRALIYHWYTITRCRRCDVIVAEPGGVFRMCIVHNECLCFTCHHRSRCPSS